MEAKELKHKKPEDIKTLSEFMTSDIFAGWLQTHSYDEIHKCYTCPMIQDEIQHRIETFCDMDGELYYHNVEDFIEDLRFEVCDYCWCEKGGGKIWWFGGSCDDYE